MQLRQRVHAISVALTAWTMFICFPCSRTEADMVFVQGQEPVAGVWISEVNGIIQILKFNGDEPLERLSIPSSTVVRIVRSIDTNQLAKLTPTEPQGYRDQAELLTSYESDPYAQYLAKRLYFLAAFWGRGTIRTSGFRGLIQLTDEPESDRRIRALAFQIDPLHDVTWLDGFSRSESAANSASAMSDEIRRKQLRLLQAIRGRNFKQADELLDSISRSMTEDFHGMLPMLENICSAQSMTPAELSQVARLEVELLTGNIIDIGWNELSLNSPTDFRSVSFDSISVFDPQQSVYRDHRWVEVGDSNIDKTNVDKTNVDQSKK